MEDCASKWKEIEQAVKKARASSSPGPNGVPYRVYKSASGVLRILWKLMKVAWEKHVQSKRLKRQEEFSKAGLTWKKIVQFVNEHLDKKEQPAANEDLHAVLKAARQIVGAEFGQDMIESAAVFLFTTFYAKDQLGQEETRTIKQMFGPFPSSSASAACNAVNRVTSIFDETQLETFIKTHSANCLKDQVPFGKNITFSFDLYALDHLEDLPLNNDDEKGPKEFSLDYDKFVNNQQEHLRNGSFDKDCPRSSGNTDGSLLRREVEKYLLEGTLGSTTAEDLCTTLFESLASTKSDDELQNEQCRSFVVKYTRYNRTQSAHVGGGIAKTFVSYPGVERKCQEGRPRNLDLSLPAGKPSSACIVEETDQLEETNVR
ncbi:UNVERIFIED_CONTAM: hypothetical protein FKN15_063512 [Acipenser sinensis]